MTAAAKPLPRLLSFDFYDGVDEAASGGQGAASGPAYGYDLLVRVLRATNLVAADWWNGLSDPYVVFNITTPDGTQLQYRTRTVFSSLNPTFDEFFEVGNVPPQGCRIGIKVWDKDLITPDDKLGRATWEFSPQQLQQPGQQESLTAGRLPLQLKLLHPTRPNMQAGQLELEVAYHPSQEPGSVRMLGPVRFRQQLSPVSGLLMRHLNDDASMAYSTWKLFLCHIEELFGDVRQPWNRGYAAACKIFNNPVLHAAVRTQHATLYATQLGPRSRFGVLRSPADFFALFNGGRRQGAARYFTYSLMQDSLRCSETGAAFFADFMSKHSMHAGGAEEVLFAGEFCIVADEQVEGGHRLVIDNNSGTYAPKAQYLPLMHRLLTLNFPGMAVETLASDDPRLHYYHRLCPSRLKAQQAAAAAAAAAADEAAADAAQAPNGAAG